MAKLWDKGKATDGMVESFTVGNDYIIDMSLVPADVLGNVAHARTLHKLGIFTEAELKRIESALRQIFDEFQAGKFAILPEQEDVHTAVENRLIELVGELGKKIHTGRSRNDQAIVDMRLYMRGKANELNEAALDASEEACRFADKHKGVPMPGYTHTRAGMPSSVGLWAASLAELLIDDVALLDAAHALLNRSPLGSAAGYGVPLALDRQFTADQLGFDSVQNNTLAVQNGRGKFELALVDACRQVMLDLSRAAADIILFSMPEFGYLVIPDELTTGSSIMPQKRNPDVLELVRAKAAELNAASAALAGILTGLISGYNRDAQLTKEHTMRAIDTTLASLRIMRRLFQGLAVNEARCSAAFTPDIFAADAALDAAVHDNIPFRDAYKKIGTNIDSLKTRDPKKALESRTHAGAPGNLGLDGIFGRIEKLRKSTELRNKAQSDTKSRLLGI